MPDPDVYNNKPLNKKHQITILSYTVELDDVYSTDQEDIDDRHIRTDEFFDIDILKARKKACDYFREESNRLKPKLEKNKDKNRRLGLMLYYTFQKNDTSQAGECAGCERCYIIDGEGGSTLDLLERLQQEYFHLISAGVEFNSIEVEMKGEAYFVALGGLFEIGNRKEPF
jgi:hypothetical protein